MKYLNFIFIIFFAIAFSQLTAIFNPAKAGLLLNFRELAIYDLDKMNGIVKAKIKESKKQKDRGGVVPLKEALQAILSRPDYDNMIEKVLPPIRQLLEERDEWAPTVEELADEALNALKRANEKSKNFAPVVQVTYVIFLENLIGEFKPQAVGPGFERRIIEKIKEAKIELSSEAKSFRYQKVMETKVSPSERADQVLKELDAEKKVKVEPVGSDILAPRSDSKSEELDKDSKSQKNQKSH